MYISIWEPVANLKHNSRKKFHIKSSIGQMNKQINENKSEKQAHKQMKPIHLSYSF